MFETERYFDETGDPGRAFGMPDIPFDRADQTSIFRLSPPSKNCSEAFDLDWIAHARTRAVSFDVLNIRR